MLTAPVPRIAGVLPGTWSSGKVLQRSPRELRQPACDSLGRNAALLTLPQASATWAHRLFVNEMSLGTRFQQLAWKLESSLGLLGWGTGKPSRLT